MTEKTNKKESKKKILYIIISIIASVSLWAYVTYVDNPDKTVVIDNIVVEHVGEEILRENNLVLTSMDTDTLTLAFSGKRNTLTKLDGAYITATVDLEEIVETYSATAGVYQLGYDLDYGGVVSPSAVSVTNTSKNYVAVTVEKLVSDRVPVKVVNSVQVADGFIAEKEELSVNYISVNGPQSEISKIDSARVEIMREDVSKPIVEDIPITLVDADGNPVDTTYITMNTETVAVTIPVLMVKKVPLKVEYIATVNVNGNDAVSKIEPEYLELSGTPEELENIKEIVLGTINLADFETEMEKTYSISIPSGLKNVTKTPVARVSVTLPKFKVKTVTTANIQLRGIPAGSAVYLKELSETVTLRGTSDNLNKVTGENVRVVADFSGVSSIGNSASVIARVYIDDVTGIDVMGDCRVEIVSE